MVSNLVMPCRHKSQGKRIKIFFAGFFHSDGFKTHRYTINFGYVSF